MNKNEIFLHFFLNSTSLVDSTFFLSSQRIFYLCFSQFFEGKFFSFFVSAGSSVF